METEAKKSRLTSAVDLFSKSLEVVKKNLNAYILIYAIPAALVAAGEFQVINDSNRQGWSWDHLVSSSTFGPGWGSGTVHVTGAILSAVLLVAGLISYFLAIILNLRAAEGRSPTLSSVWKEYRENWLWLKLVGLIITVGLLTILGLLLLVIPGIILIWRWFLAPYILINQKTSISEAMSKSWELTKGYAGAIYGVIIFGFVLSLTGIIPVAGAVISFILGVCYAAAPALRYLEIKKAS